MRIAVLGMGYVGFTAACCMASEGHSVIGIDVSERKVRQIMDGTAPIVEPKVDDMLRQAITAGRIETATSIATNLDDCDLAIVCVGTPSTASGAHNMGFIADVTRQIAGALEKPRERPLVLVYRSTFRPGTIEELVLPILQAALGREMERRVEVVYNPEFLREGLAVDDYFAPPKIVVGTRDGGPNELMDKLNANLDSQRFTVGYREAELTKFVDNSWHAVKVAFANEIGRTCLALGISARQVHEIFVADTKLNISAGYLRPGGAFGGSCLPKDVRALQHIAADTGTNLPLISSLLGSNEAHKHRLFEYATAELKPGDRILLVGLAFKAGTDDLRESPNVDLARKLLASGFELEIYDPGVDATKLVGANLGYAYSQLPVLERLLVGRAHAQSASYARVIATNNTIDDLTLSDSVEVMQIGRLP